MGSSSLSSKRSRKGSLSTKLEDNLPSHKINYTLFFLLSIKPLVNSSHVKELHFIGTLISPFFVVSLFEAFIASEKKKYFCLQSLLTGCTLRVSIIQKF